MRKLFYVVEGEWYVCSWDYDPDVIASIKGNIPSSQRQYDPATRTWRFHKTVWSTVRRTFDGLGYDVPPRPSDEEYSPPVPSTSDGPYALLYVTDNAPMPVVDAALRVLARMYHPDGGSEPDPRRMSQINAAYTEIKEKRAKEAQTS